MHRGEYRYIPLNVAHSLGYNLLPGLLALKNEGALCVDRDYPTIESDCLRLVIRCEQVRSEIEKDIDAEYRQMELGGSLLEQLINDALSLVQRALAVR